MTRTLFFVSFTQIIKRSFNIFYRPTMPSFKFNAMSSSCETWGYCKPIKFDIQINAFIKFERNNLFIVKRITNYDHKVTRSGWCN